MLNDDKNVANEDHPESSAVSEFLKLLGQEKKWLLMPIVVVAVLSLLALILYYTGVLEPLLAPFLYPIY